MMNEKEKILYLIRKETDIDLSQISHIFQHGSRVYGCNDSESDYDLIMVSYDGSDEINTHSLDCQIFNYREFCDRIMNHEISVL